MNSTLGFIRHSIKHSSLKAYTKMWINQQNKKKCKNRYVHRYVSQYCIGFFFILIVHTDSYLFENRHTSSVEIWVDEISKNIFSSNLKLTCLVFKKLRFFGYGQYSDTKYISVIFMGWKSFLIAITKLSLTVTFKKKTLRKYKLYFIQNIHYNLMNICKF